MTAFLGAVLVMAGGSALANSMGGSMMMPKCEAGDQVVGVNMATKMYMTKDQMHAKMAGMSADQKQAMMMKYHVKMMCKSRADAMGAKMMHAGPANGASNAGQ